MRNLLTHTYPSAHNVSPLSLVYPTEVKTGAFVLYDHTAACLPCKQKLRELADCDEKMLLVHADNDVEVVRLDQYLNQFMHGNIPQNCDYLLFDADVDIRKIALCDLTCSNRLHVEPNPEDKYPEGKRAKTRSQMMESLKSLCIDPLLASRIFSIPRRLAIFGWRERNMKSTLQDKAASAMRTFGRTASSEAHVLEYPDLSIPGGFTFLEVKYPFVYQWTESKEDIATYE